MLLERICLDFLIIITFFSLITSYYIFIYGGVYRVSYGTTATVSYTTKTTYLVPRLLIYLLNYLLIRCLAAHNSNESIFHVKRL